MPSAIDRTSEFRSTVQSLRTRSNRNAQQQEQKEKLLDSKQQHSQFAMMASQIARDIHQTSSKLEKLAKLAKRKSLFDDRPVEIVELTAVIKSEITSLNQQISSLQSFAKGRRGKSGTQESEHSENVVVGLQSNLARASKDFAAILDVRTQNLQAQRDRRDQFSATPAFVPSAMSQSSSPLYNPEIRMRTPNSQQDHGSHEQSSDFLSIDMQMSQTQQTAMINQQSAYIDSRNAAVESIESTITELGQIFQQLGQLVAQQREQVVRIDANVDDIESNVQGAQKELLKYWASVSSNRMLMVKIFAVVLVFFLVFVFML
ncbi:Integral membrane protein SED5 [Sorochytrium milnesiophthora]